MTKDLQNFEVPDEDTLVLSGGVEGDDYPRFKLYGDGRLQLGPGDVDTAADEEAWVYIRVAREDQNGVLIKGHEPAGIHQIFMIMDYLGAPITFVNTDGTGLGTTDNIRFMQDVFTDLIRLTFTGTSESPTARSNPAIVFGEEEVGGGDTRTVKDRLYLESTGTLRSTMTLSSNGSVVAEADGAIVVTGAVGPGFLGGFQVGLDAAATLYRASSGVLRATGQLQADGSITADVDSTIVTIGAVGPGGQGGIQAGVDASATIYRPSSGLLRMPGSLTVDGNLIVSGNLTVSGTVTMTGLPTANPGGSGKVWNDSGTLKIT